MKAVGEDFIEMEMTDQKNHTITRKITWENPIFISDVTESGTLTASLHFPKNAHGYEIVTDAPQIAKACPYSEEFGKSEIARETIFSGRNRMDVQIKLLG